VVEHSHSVVVVVLLVVLDGSPVVVVVLLVVLVLATPQPLVSIDHVPVAAAQTHLQVPEQADTSPAVVVVVLLVVVVLVVLVNGLTSASTTQRRSGFCSAVSRTPGCVSASGLAFQNTMVTTLPSDQR